MTKKQIVFVSVTIVILIILIVGTIAYAGKNNEIEQSKAPEIKVERRNIPQPAINDVLPENNQESTTSKTDESASSQTTQSETNKSESSQTTQGVLSSGNLLRKTIETAPPESSGYPIPKTHHFYEIRGSVMPGNKDYAELSIDMDITKNYDIQLRELRKIIQPVLGENITNQIIEVAKKKTADTVEIYKRFETDTKEVSIGSSYGNPIVSFQSWQK